MFRKEWPTACSTSIIIIWAFLVFKLVSTSSTNGLHSFGIQNLSYLIATEFHPFNRYCLVYLLVKWHKDICTWISKIVSNIPYISNSIENEVFSEERNFSNIITNHPFFSIQPTYVIEEPAPMELINNVMSFNTLYRVTVSCVYSFIPFSSSTPHHPGQRLLTSTERNSL